MKWREASITVIALAAIAAVSFWAYRNVSRPPANLCRVCERGIHQGVTYRLELAGGSEDVCCPRCGMHYQIQHPGAVKRVWATDLDTGEFIAAESAYYVEGGDIEYCTMHSTPVERQPQGVSVRDYDRCLPSLVAFRTEQEAETYQKRHGGRVVDFSGALESVKER